MSVNAVRLKKGGGRKLKFNLTCCIQYAEMLLYKINCP